MEFHTIPPIYDNASRILILGSFPSVKSRESRFYYGHPQNRFWKVLSSVLQTPLPQTNTEKTHLLLDHGVALWDVISSCEISGSSDASINHVVPNDIRIILNAANIQTIFCNGAKAHSLYNTCLRAGTAQEAIKLPSTSPANASWSLERLVSFWRDEFRRCGFLNT